MNETSGLPKGFINKGELIVPSEKDHRMHTVDPISGIINSIDGSPKITETKSTRPSANRLRSILDESRATRAKQRLMRAKRKANATQNLEAVQSNPERQLPNHTQNYSENAFFFSQYISNQDGSSLEHRLLSFFEINLGESDKDTRNFVQAMKEVPQIIELIDVLGEKLARKFLSVLRRKFNTYNIDVTQPRDVNIFLQMCLEVKSDLRITYDSNTYGVAKKGDGKIEKIGGAIRFGEDAVSHDQDHRSFYCVCDGVSTPFKTNPNAEGAGSVMLVNILGLRQAEIAEVANAGNLVALDNLILDILEEADQTIVSTKGPTGFKPTTLALLVPGKDSNGIPIVMCYSVGDSGVSEIAPGVDGEASATRVAIPHSKNFLSYFSRYRQEKEPDSADIIKFNETEEIRLINGDNSPSPVYEVIGTGSLDRKKVFIRTLRADKVYVLHTDGLDIGNAPMAKAYEDPQFNPIDVNRATNDDATCIIIRPIGITINPTL